MYSILFEFVVTMKLCELTTVCVNEIYNNVCILKYLTDAFAIRSSL
jgi:hypothetical protein